MLDASGNVVALNQTAFISFGGKNRERMINAPMLQLLFPELTAAQVDDYWAKLKAAAGTWTDLLSEIRGGDKAPLVLLERAHGGAGSYIAILAFRQ